MKQEEFETHIDEAIRLHESMPEAWHKIPIAGGKKWFSQHEEAVIGLTAAAKRKKVQVNVLDWKLAEMEAPDLDRELWFHISQGGQQNTRPCRICVSTVEFVEHTH